MNNSINFPKMSTDMNSKALIQCSESFKCKESLCVFFPSSRSQVLPWVCPCHIRQFSTLDAMIEKKSGKSWNLSNIPWGLSCILLDEIFGMLPTSQGTRDSLIIGLYARKMQVSRSFWLNNSLEKVVYFTSKRWIVSLNSSGKRSFPISVVLNGRDGAKTFKIFKFLHDFPVSLVGPSAKWSIWSCRIRRFLFHILLYN